MTLSLSGLEQYLAEQGVFATVYDNYMDPTLPPHTIMIETEADENIVMALIGPRMPWGLQFLVRNPGQYLGDPPESQSCI